MTTENKTTTNTFNSYSEVADSVKNSFTYHPPKADQVPRYEALRTKAHELATMIVETCPPSRERSTAITRLEESVMWANKSIACNETTTH